MIDPRVETWLQALDPEFSERPIYIVRASQAGLSTAGCHAWTAPALDLRLRDHLEQAGTWRGRGAAVAWGDGPLSAGILIHELAHRLVFPLEPGEGASVVAPEPGPRETHPVQHGLAPWSQHDPWMFVRAVSHLLHRSEQSRWWPLGRVEPLEAMRHTLYALSPLSRYLEVLNDELRLQQRAPIRSVLKTNPPGAFRELATRDQMTWLQANVPEFTPRCDVARQPA